MIAQAAENQGCKNAWHKSRLPLPIPRVRTSPRGSGAFTPYGSSFSSLLTMGAYLGPAKRGYSDFPLGDWNLALLAEEKIAHAVVDLLLSSFRPAILPNQPTNR